MASNYNRRSGSSGSPSRNSQGSRNKKTGARQSSSRGGSSSSRSYRDSGITLEESRRRARATAQPRRAVPVKLIITATLIVGLLVAALCVYNSSFLTVTEVQVEGTERLTAAHLTELAAVPSDSTLLRVDVNGITERLQSDPWVKSVTVRRVLPSTIVLEIAERSIEAVVEIPSASASGTSQRWLISSDGLWMSQVNDTATTDDGTTDETSTETATGSVSEDALVTPDELGALPAIVDVPRSTVPVAGEVTEDTGILNALSILVTLGTELRDQVATISAPDADKTVLTLDNGVGIAFGAAEDIENKELVILQLLEEHEGALSYINVRVADRPTWRGID